MQPSKKQNSLKIKIDGLDESIEKTEKLAKNYENIADSQEKIISNNTKIDSTLTTTNQIKNSSETNSSEIGLIDKMKNYARVLAYMLLLQAKGTEYDPDKISDALKDLNETLVAFADPFISIPHSIIQAKNNLIDIALRSLEKGEFDTETFKKNINPIIKAILQILDTIYLKGAIGKQEGINNTAVSVKGNWIDHEYDQKKIKILNDYQDLFFKITEEEEGDRLIIILNELKKNKEESLRHNEVLRKLEIAFNEYSRSDKMGDLVEYFNKNETKEKTAIGEIEYLSLKREENKKHEENKEKIAREAEFSLSKIGVPTNQVSKNEVKDWYEDKNSFDNSRTLQINAEKVYTSTGQSKDTLRQNIQTNYNGDVFASYQESQRPENRKKDEEEIKKAEQLQKEKEADEARRKIDENYQKDFEKSIQYNLDTEARYNEAVKELTKERKQIREDESATIDKIASTSSDDTDKPTFFASLTDIGRDNSIANLNEFLGIDEQALNKSVGSYIDSILQAQDANKSTAKQTQETTTEKGKYYQQDTANVKKEVQQQQGLLKTLGSSFLANGRTLKSVIEENSDSFGEGTKKLAESILEQQGLLAKFKEFIEKEFKGKKENEDKDKDSAESENKENPSAEQSKDTTGKQADVSFPADPSNLDASKLSGVTKLEEITQMASDILASDIIGLDKSVSEKIGLLGKLFLNVVNINKKINNNVEESGKEGNKLLGDTLDRAEKQVKSSFDKILEYSQLLMESVGQVFSWINESMQSQIEEADEQYEAISEKYDEVADKIQENDSRIKSLHEEAKNAQGGRLAIIQEQIGREIESRQELASEEQRLAKEKEKAEAEKAKLEKKMKKMELQQQLAQSIVNIAQGVTRALSLGPIVGPIMAAVVTAMGAIQIATISKQISKLADGGLLKGRTHAQGGMRIDGTNIEVEGGEYVVNRVSTGKNAGLLHYINSQRRRLTPRDLDGYFNSAGGYNESPNFKTMFAEGGTLPSEAVLNTYDNNRMIRAIESINIEPVVSVVDIVNVQKNLTKVTDWTNTQSF